MGKPNRKLEFSIYNNYTRVDSRIKPRKKHQIIASVKYRIKGTRFKGIEKFGSKQGVDEEELLRSLKNNAKSRLARFYDVDSEDVIIQIIPSTKKYSRLVKNDAIDLP